MKNFGMLLTLVLLTACNGGGSGSSSPKKNVLPVKQDPLPDYVPVTNITDSQIDVNEETKTITVYPAKSEVITLEPYGIVNANIGFCYELKSYIKNKKNFKKIKDEVEVAERDLRSLKARKAEIEQGDPERLEREYELLLSQIESAEQTIRVGKKQMVLLNDMIKYYSSLERYSAVSATVKKEGKWERNFYQISEDNRGWNVVYAPYPLKVSLKAKGLEMLPAEKMVNHLSTLGMNEENGVIMLRNYDDMRDTNLMLYAACPLYSNEDFGIPKLEEKKIEIEMKFLGK